MDPRRLAPVLLFVGFVLLVVYLRREEGNDERSPAPAPSGTTRSSRDGPRESESPRGAAPGIPGGSLSANEGISGAHTVERHVGRSTDDLRRRAAQEAKREVSSFPDLATADRAVADVLRIRRDEIERWLGRRDDGLQDFEARLDRTVGTVYRRDTGRVVEGRTVIVVLARTDRFPQGFRIHTAYVTTP